MDLLLNIWDQRVPGHAYRGAIGDRGEEFIKHAAVTDEGCLKWNERGCRAKGDLTEGIELVSTRSHFNDPPTGTKTIDDASN